MQVPVCNNMAMCLTKQGHYERACSMLDQVLKLDPVNTKAMVRKMQNKLKAGGQTEEVKADLEILKNKLTNNELPDEDNLFM